MNNDEFLDEDNVLRIESMFVSLEEDYIKNLLIIPEFQIYLSRYFKYSNNELVEHFGSIYEKMERGEVPEDEEEAAELSMIACVLAMADKVKRLIKVKTPNYDKGEDLAHGRSR